MSVSSTSISSATGASPITFSGLVSGVDTSSIIQKLMAVQSQPLVAMQNEQTQLQQQQTDYMTLNNDLMNLSNAVNTLQDQTTFDSMTATSSSPTVLSATAASGTNAGTYNVVVSGLAQNAEVAATNAFTDSTTQTVGSLLGSNFTAGTISVGGANVSVASTDTLSDIVNNINAAQSNLTATEIGNKLVLTAAQGGATNQITVGTAGPYTLSDGTSNLLSQLGVYTGTTVNSVQLGTSANLTVNNIPVTSNSNTLTNAVAGLTINLASTGSSTVQVATDTKTASDAVQNFVTQYNAVMDFIDSNSQYDSTSNTAGVFMGDITVMQLQQSLRDMISTTVSGPGSSTNYNTLFQVGINTSSTNNDLSFNTNSFATAMSADPSAVSTLFGASTRTNIALSSSGATATSSVSDTNFNPNAVLSGNTSDANWGDGALDGGWQSAALTGTQTLATNPADLYINLNGTQNVNEVMLQTVNSASMPTSQYGISNVEVDYLDQNGTWQTAQSITGNTNEYMDMTFNSVSTSQLRVRVTGANGTGDTQARLVSAQVFPTNNGVASQMNDLIQNYTMYGTGILPGVQASLSSQIQDLSTQMSDLNNQLTLEQTNLQNEFNAMETAIQGFQSQGSALSSMLSTSTSSTSTSSSSTTGTSTIG
ncbi:MAG: flagellar filament capping protein FliD [Peptococcaceae bacterium]|nr:flagellar filament capping protein FliD [Peptococcaceae bacterium]